MIVIVLALINPMSKLVYKALVFALHFAIWFVLQV